MCRIIFHFFRFYYAEVRRKLWPKAPAKEGTLGQMSKKCQVYFIHIIFFKKQTKKIYNRAKELYCDATIFVFDSLISTCPKKMKTEKWSKAADSPLLKCFSRWHLIAKCIEFCFEVRTRLFFCMIIVKPVYNLSTLLIKILLGWSAKDLEILQAQNIAFRLQHKKVSVLRLIPRLVLIQPLAGKWAKMLKFFMS